jgi:hypothetical protein
MSTATNIMSSILKTVPLEWILPVVFDKILATVKNPNSAEARNLEKILVPFGTSLVSHYPGKICPNHTPPTD